MTRSAGRTQTLIRGVLAVVIVAACAAGLAAGDFAIIGVATRPSAPGSLVGPAGPYRDISMSAAGDALTIAADDVVDGRAIPAIAVAITVIGLFGLRRVSSRHPAIVEPGRKGRRGRGRPLGRLSSREAG
jgi:hypothetical protein